MLCEVPFPTAFCREDKTHLALEFDRSWVAHLPLDADELIDELTPRGYVARFLLACAERPRMQACRLWLIDRDLRLPKSALDRKDEHCQAVFYDLERRQYLAPDEEDLRNGSPHDWEYRRSSHFFVEWLTSTGDFFFKLRRILVGAEEFDVEEYLGILACV